MAELRGLRWKGWAAGGLLVSVAAGAAVMQTEILRWSLNRFALDESGLAIAAAEELSLDLLSLAQGAPQFKGTGIELQHAALPDTMHIASVEGRAALGDGRTTATFRIGDYPGSLEAQQLNGGLESFVLLLGRGTSSLDARYTAGRMRGRRQALPELRISGRRAAPILAALLDRRGQELAALPDDIAVALSPTAERQLTIDYRLQGPKLLLAGRGAADLRRATVTHAATVRWEQSEREDEAENAIGAAREQLTLVADEAASVLQRFAIRSDVDLTLIDPQRRATYYGIGLRSAGSAGRARNDLGHLRLTSRAAPEAPALTLLDARLGGVAGDSRLTIVGRTELTGAARPIDIRLRGRAGEPVDGLGVTIGQGSAASKLALDLEFTKAMLGGPGVRVTASGSLPALRASPRSPAPLADALTLLALLEKRDAPTLTLGGAIELDDKGMSFDAFKAAGRLASVTLDGELEADGGGSLRLAAKLADLDLATPAREAMFTAAAQRIAAAFADPAAKAPALDVSADIRQLRLRGQLVRGVTLAYDPTKALGITADALVVGRETLLTDASVDLPLPLKPGAAMVARATTKWGPATASFWPTGGRELSQIVGQGGRLAVTLPGLQVTGTMPRQLRGTGAFRLVLGKPADAPWLKSLIGSGVDYWPDEVVTGSARVGFTPRGPALANLTLSASSVEMSASPLGGSFGPDQPVRVALAGRLRDFIRDPKLLPSDALGNQRAEASFILRSAGAGFAFEDIRAGVGALKLAGAFSGRSASDLAGTLTVRAARAGEASALFPSLLGMLPPDMLGHALVMPVDFRGTPRGLALRVAGARLGPLTLSSDVGLASAGDGDTSAKVVIAGPIAATFLADTPPWLRELLGTRQTLTANLIVNPRRAVEARSLELDSGRVQVRGRLDLPMHGGSFDWAAARGQLAGEIDAFRWKALDLPKGRYELVLKGADAGERVAGTLVYPSLYGGTANLRLALGGKSASDGRVELSLANVNLADACRHAGFRLFATGRLDAELRGAAPALLFSRAGESGSLVEALMRSATANGRIEIRDGALNDVDLTQRTAGGDADGGVATGTRTPFDELSGTMLLRDGTLQISDGRFETAGYSLSVGGTTQLPRLAMDLLVKGQVAVLSRVSTGKTLISAPILPLAIRGTPDKPSYEFLPGQLPGTRAITNSLVEGAKTAQRVDASVAASQKKVDKLFSDKFFRPLLGRKQKASEPSTPSAAAAPAEALAPEAGGRKSYPVCGS